MLRKVGLVAAGVGAFFVASVGVSLIGMGVSALIPGASKDKPGRLDPDPQRPAKAEWLQQLEGGGLVETRETKTETKQEPVPEPIEQPASKPEPAATQAPMFQQPDPTHPAAPPAPKVGPGNFDIPSPYEAPPVIQSGPGNM